MKAIQRKLHSKLQLLQLKNAYLINTDMHNNVNNKPIYILQTPLFVKSLNPADRCFPNH